MLRRASLGAYGGYGYGGLGLGSYGGLGLAGGMPMSMAYSGLPYASRGLAGGVLAPGLAAYGAYGGYAPGMMPGLGLGGYGGLGMATSYPYAGDLMTSAYMARGGSYMAPMF